MHEPRFCPRKRLIVQRKCESIDRVKSSNNMSQHRYLQRKSEKLDSTSLQVHVPDKAVRDAENTRENRFAPSKSESSTDENIHLMTEPRENQETKFSTIISDTIHPML
jgi:hypothetical protein